MTTDEELMEAVRAGDLERLGALFERHQRRAFGFLRGLGLDPASAEDALQETFSRLLRYRRSYRPGQKFLPWFVGILRNCALARWRRSEPEHTHLDELESIEDPIGTLPAFALAQRDLVTRALAQLPAAQRDVVLLSYFEDLDAAEIGALVGARPGTVRVRLHRGLRALERILEERPDA